MDGSLQLRDLERELIKLIGRLSVVNTNVGIDKIRARGSVSIPKSASPLGSPSDTLGAADLA